MAPNLPAKLELQKSLRQMETKRNEAWKEYDAAALEVEKKKDQLLDEISKRLDQKTATEELFLFRWLIA
jgi:shikimate kinase